MNACRSVWGPTRLVIPARRAMRRTIRRGGVAIEPIAVGAAKIGSFTAFTDGEIDGAGGAGRQRDRHDLAALAQDRQGAMPAFEPESFDVGAGRFGDPKPIQSQQADERVIAGAGESGSDQHGADLVAVQARGVRLVVETRTPDVHCRRESRSVLLLRRSGRSERSCKAAEQSSHAPGRASRDRGRTPSISARRAPNNATPMFCAPLRRTGGDRAGMPHGSSRCSRPEPGECALLVAREQLVADHYGPCRRSELHRNLPTAAGDSFDITVPTSRKSEARP